MTISPLKMPSRTSSVPKEYVEVAKGLEEQFYQHLVEEMHKSIPLQEEKSSEMDYYQSLLFAEYANKLSDSQENGPLRKMILDNLLQKR